MAHSARSIAPELLTTGSGQFHLQRFPDAGNSSLRAWDAADEYLLQSVPAAQGRCLVVNDAFGALSLALHQHPVTHWSDSWLAQQAVKKNLELNSITPRALDFLPSTSAPTGHFDSVWIKIPKNLALLEHQLRGLRECINQNSVVFLAGMIKYLPVRLWSLVESIIGSTETAPGRKKSKLIRAVFDPDLKLPPASSPLEWSMPTREFSLINHANVFSRERLDIGARLLLDCLPHTSGPTNIVDLGCGNGVLGLIAAHANPASNVHFIDESWMAIESARTNVRQLGSREGQLNFSIGDGLRSLVSLPAQGPLTQSVEAQPATLKNGKVDLILCNPPFHQQQAITIATAQSMFAEAATALNQQGELWVVGNRHLGYHQRLKRWFKAVNLVTSNRKFVVLQALKL